MARIGGRNTWIAVPAGMLCAAVVGGARVARAADGARHGHVGRRHAAQRHGAAAERHARQTPAQTAAQGGALDCRALYPDGLWTELTWRPGSLLADAGAAGDGGDLARRCAAPRRAGDVHVADRQRAAIVTTLAEVDADAGGDRRRRARG